MGRKLWDCLRYVDLLSCMLIYDVTNTQLARAAVTELLRECIYRPGLHKSTTDDQTLQYKTCQDKDPIAFPNNMADLQLDKLAPFVIKTLERSEEDVGRGSFGIVCEVKVNGLPCIAKRLHSALVSKQLVSQQDRDAITARFLDECLLLSRLRHPNIVQFLGVHFGQDRYDLTLVMERMHMDLEVALKKFPNIPLASKIRILLDASYGLLHLHSQSPPIIHRDFTAANILLSPDLRAKVADLGVSKILDVSPHQPSKQSMCPGALAYMSPEVLRPHPKYGVELDVFSFGHVALYTANQAFPNVYELEENCSVRSGNVQITRRRIFIDKMGTDHCLHKLIINCLHDSPEQRPTTSEVTRHLQQLSVLYPPIDTPAFIQENEKLRRSKEQLQQEVMQWKTQTEIHEHSMVQLEADFAKINSDCHQLKQDFAEANTVAKRVKEALETELYLVKLQCETYKEDFKQERNDRESIMTRANAKEQSYKQELEHTQTELHRTATVLEQYKKKCSDMEGHMGDREEKMRQQLAMKDAETKIEQLQQSVVQIRSESESFHAQAEAYKDTAEKLALELNHTRKNSLSQLSQPSCSDERATLYPPSPVPTPAAAAIPLSPTIPGETSAPPPLPVKRRLRIYSDKVPPPVKPRKHTLSASRKPPEEPPIAKESPEVPPRQPVVSVNEILNHPLACRKSIKTQKDLPPYSLPHPQQTDPSWAPKCYIEKVKALCDYDTGKDNELSFTAGTIIYVVKKNDYDWYEGIVDGMSGFFPGETVAKLESGIKL